MGANVFRILEDSVGIPEYYRWRSRSGCYFCFFQRRDEWIGLAENHPGLFERAKQYERVDPETGRSFTWVQDATLDQVFDDREAIKESVAKRVKPGTFTWQEQVLQAPEEDDPACLVCTL